MNWRLKAAIQKGLALTRISDKLNHIPVLLNKNHHNNVYQYQAHECLRKLNACDFELHEDAVALEIGTGYSIISSVCLVLLGFKHVVTVDITKDLSFSSFKKQIRYLHITSLPSGFSSKSLLSETALKHRIDLIKNVNSFAALYKLLNIEYIAPYTFESLHRDYKSFDYIASQVVLEHMPPEELDALFHYSKMYLTYKGFAVHCINFIDHFANPGLFQDKSISEFNFLRYSDRCWKFWAGNSIAYTNRLCYLYYIDLAATYGLNVISFKGKNYREHVPLDENLIHKDIINKYKTIEDIKALTKYQRGTLVLSSRYSKLG